MKSEHVFMALLALIIVAVAVVSIKSDYDKKAEYELLSERIKEATDQQKKIENERKLELRIKADNEASTARNNQRLRDAVGDEEALERFSHAYEELANTRRGSK